MARFRFSIRGLMIALVIVGFDSATLTRAVRAAGVGHSGFEIVYIAAMILAFLNIMVIAIYREFARKANSPQSAQRILKSPPSPPVIFGLYTTMLAVVILSVLFFSSGKF